MAVLFACKEAANDDVVPSPTIASTQGPTTEITQKPTDEPSPESTNVEPKKSTFEIHFIDVGQGDSMLILCDGNAALVDGGNAESSSKIYSYLKAHNVEKLEYIFATHNDADHIGGLAGALNYATVGNAFAPSLVGDSIAFGNFTKYLLQQNVSLEVPNVGDIFTIGSAKIYVLGPLKDYTDTNNSSLVLKIEYGDTSFLLTGDAELEAENDLMAAGCDIKVNVIKVAHHGSANGSGEDFLRRTGAKFAVISVGEDNAYGHPAGETLSRLENLGMVVFRTDKNGTIICASDGRSIAFSCQKSDIKPSHENTSNYIGNKNSLAFHRPTCPNLPLEKNRVYFETRNEAILNGYHPCKNCNP